MVRHGIFAKLSAKAQTGPPAVAPPEVLPLDLLPGRERAILLTTDRVRRPPIKEIEYALLPMPWTYGYGSFLGL
jgi:hypothetical protein